ncbi:Bacterial mobilisation domain-containing protein, partial [Dysosmobacter welbionis]
RAPRSTSGLCAAFSPTRRTRWCLRTPSTPSRPPRPPGSGWRRCTTRPRRHTRRRSAGWRTTISVPLRRCLRPGSWSDRLPRKTEGPSGPSGPGGLLCQRVRI